MYLNQMLGQQVFINEIMSNNENLVIDEDGDFPDWIELYNSTNQNINLLNWSLSDDRNELTKWTFPQTTIEANSHLLIYASGKDKKTNQLHTNFKIKSEGEDLFLVQSNGTMHDSLLSIYIPKNTSFGRKNDGSSELVYFETSSPNSSNNGSETTIIPTEKLIFSHEAGWYSEDFSLLIQSSGADQIYYTRDGSVPSIQSDLYQQNIPIKSKESKSSQISNISTSPQFWETPSGSVFQVNTIRAASFSNGIRNSPIYSRSFLIHAQKAKRYPFEVISLMTDNKGLFSRDSGVQVFGKGDPDNPWSANYYRRGRPWEREVHLEYFGKNGNLEFKQDAGMRIHGLFSRKLPQKSMRLYARKEYGEPYFNHPFFKQKPLIDKYKRIVLRSVNPNYFHVPFKDELCHLLVQEMGLAYQAFNPAIVFVNGEYWGVYNLRERQDEYYIASNYNIPEDEVSLLERDGEPISGAPLIFEEFKIFISNNDFSDAAKYEELKSKMNVSNFMDFLVAQMYFESWDFPEQNLRYWTSPETKLQWLFNDGDVAMYEYWHSKLIKILFPNNTDVDGLFFTQLVQKLLRNESFKKELYAKFIFHLDNSLSPHNVISKVDYLQAQYDPVMPEHILRWGYPNTMYDYHAATDHIRQFAALRPATLITDLRNLFGQPFSIYPNPVDQDLQIDFFAELMDEEISFIINDALGNLVQEGRLDNAIMDWSNMLPGTYFLSLNINGIWYAEQVVKK